MKWIRGNAFFWIGLALLGFGHATLAAPAIGIMLWCIPGFAQWFEPTDVAAAAGRTAVMLALGCAFAFLCMIDRIGPAVPVVAAIGILAYKLYEGEVSRLRNRAPMAGTPVAVTVMMPSGSVTTTAQATIIQD